MRILFVSNDLIAGDVAHRLVQEGHEVKLYIEDVARRNNFKGMVDQTTDWESELTWVGTEGLIVFDDVGYGDRQDTLRSEGYQVVGGSAGGDRLEQDRAYGQEIFRSVGMTTVPLIDFPNSKAALQYARENPKAWVIKQNNHHYSKVLNYIGQFPDGRDVIDMLERYANHKDFYQERVSLQERLYGVEIGIGRYFNGTHWVGPIEFNLEHPHFFPGDIGPLTSEMGTLAWYDENESHPLYLETLAKMESHLRSINFRGDFEINCIANEHGVFPLEATSRFGSPIVHLHTELHESPWGEFLLALARGESYQLKWKQGYGIVTVLAAPPFPYASVGEQDSVLTGVPIYFSDLTPEDMSHVHFEEVSCDPKKKEYVISDTRGYILYVTSVSERVEDAQRNIMYIIERTQFPKMMYRPDIGSKFIREDKSNLEAWGWLPRS